MSTHKSIDKICCVAMVFALLLTFVFLNGESLGIQAASSTPGYETRLFDTSSVHTIDIVMDDWDGFLETCTNEEYTLCSLVIDNESYKNVGIRAKGNTSLTQVANYGNDRYSFKIEFDHYDNTKSYYGLDKLSLNNIIQDNTYLKDYLTYQMMGWFGVDAPLCSFVSISVNGEPWGLYLAVEGVEEAFLERNYGSDYGELYKPDSQTMGGGRGNGGNFEMDNWISDQEDSDATQEAPNSKTLPEDGNPPEIPSNGENRGGFQEGGDSPGDFAGRMGKPGGMGGSMGSDDVSLIYTDDQYDSYSNIFDNAKTDITDSDKDRLIASLKQLNQQESIEDVVNVEEVLRYFVVHNFVCNFDSYTGSMIHNYYLYEEDGQLSMIPWDYNLAFGGFQGAQDATSLVNYPIDTPVSGGTVDSRPMLSWIFSSEEYTQLYHQYFQEFISQYFDSGYFTETFNSVVELISPYVEEDPTKFCDYEEFQSGVEILREFCLLRAESIDGQLDGSIPSTSEGQSQDSSALIDASSLDITAMGSMGGGMGGPNAMGNSPENSQAPQPPENGEFSPDGESAPGSGNSGSGETTFPSSGGSDSGETTSPGSGGSGSGEATSPGSGGSGSGEATSPGSGGSNSGEATSPGSGGNDSGEATSPGFGGTPPEFPQGTPPEGASPPEGGSPGAAPENS